MAVELGSTVVDPELVFISLRLLTPGGGSDASKYRSSAPCRACGDGGDHTTGSRKRRRLLTTGGSDWNIDTLFSDFHARLGTLQAELLAQHAKQKRRRRRQDGDGRSPPLDDSSGGSGGGSGSGGGGMPQHFFSHRRSAQAPGGDTSFRQGSTTPRPSAINVASSSRDNSGANDVHGKSVGAMRGAYDAGSTTSTAASFPGLQEHLEARFGRGSVSSATEAYRRHNATLVQQDVTRIIGGARSSSASSSASSPSPVPLAAGTAPSTMNLNGTSFRHHRAAASIGPGVELMRSATSTGTSAPSPPRSQRSPTAPSSSNSGGGGSGPLDREKCFFCMIPYHPKKLVEHFEKHCNLNFVCTCGEKYTRFTSLRRHVKDKKCVWNRAAHQSQLDLVNRRFNLCMGLSHDEISRRVNEWAKIAPGAETEEELLAAAATKAAAAKAAAAAAKATGDEPMQSPAAKRQKHKASPLGSAAALVSAMNGGEERNTGGSGDDEHPEEQPPLVGVQHSSPSPEGGGHASAYLPANRDDHLSSSPSRYGTSPFCDSQMNGGESGGNSAARSRNNSIDDTSPRSGSIVGEAEDGGNNMFSASFSSSSRSPSRDRSTPLFTPSSGGGNRLPTSIAPPVFLHSPSKSSSSWMNTAAAAAEGIPAGGIAIPSGDDSCPPSPAGTGGGSGMPSPSKTAATSRKQLTVPNAQRICKACDKHFSPTSPCDCVLTNQKRHVCTTCGRGFNLKYALVQHEKTVHTTARPFSCRICNASYKWKRGLVRHYRRTHKHSIGSLPRGRPRVSFPGEAYAGTTHASSDARAHSSGSLASLMSLGAPYSETSPYPTQSLPSTALLSPSSGRNLFDSRRLSEPSHLSLLLQRAGTYGNSSSGGHGSGSGLARHLEMERSMHSRVATVLQSHAAAAASREAAQSLPPAAAAGHRTPTIVKTDPDASSASSASAAVAASSFGTSRDRTPADEPAMTLFSRAAASSPPSTPSLSSAAFSASAPPLPVLQSRSPDNGDSSTRDSGQRPVPAEHRRNDIPALEHESDDADTASNALPPTSPRRDSPPTAASAAAAAATGAAVVSVPARTATVAASSGAMSVPAGTAPATAATGGAAASVPAASQVVSVRS